MDLANMDFTIDASQVGGAASSIGNFMIWALLGLLLIALILFFMHLAKFKHKAHIMDLTGSSIIHSYDKAKIWKDNHGITWFKLLKRKYKGKVPVADIKGITSKGKLHFDMYYTDDTGYSFGDQRSEVIKAKLDKLKGGKDGDPLSLTDNVEPFNTEDRTLMILQQEEAKIFKNFSWKDFFNNNGGLIVGSVALLMLVVMFIIGVDTLMPHFQELSNNEVVKAQGEVALSDAIHRMVDFLNQTKIPLAVAPQ